MDARGNESAARLRSAVRVIGAVRPWSFSMTAISVAFGTLAAASEVRIDWWLFAAALAGALFLHAATNLANDYFDFKSGVDAPGTPSVRARRHPLVERTLGPGRYSPAQSVSGARQSSLGSR